MITTPTCFILGAGASMPYGFPSARGLLEQVAHSLKDAGDQPAIERMGFWDGKEYDRFAVALLESGLNSVDEFLEARSEFLDFGRAVIAMNIARSECACNFFGQPKDGQLQRTDNPYNHILTALWDPQRKSVSSGAARFVTFNYDRSLEKYLATAVQSRRGCGYDEALADVQALGILHVYGSLGPLSTGERYFRGFGYDWDRGSANRTSSHSLGLIGEHRDEHPGSELITLGLARAREMVAASDRIIFLGFGYDQRNLARIKRLPSDRRLEIFGTACGLEKKERERVETTLLAWGKSITPDGGTRGCSVTLGDDGVQSQLFMRRHLQLAD